MTGNSDTTGSGDATGSGPEARAVRHAKGKRPQFGESAGVDQVMSMVMVLASELCVLRDRLDSIERVACARGVDLSAEIEGLALDQAALAAREQRRQDLFQRLFYLMRKEAAELAAAETEEHYKSVIDEIAQP